MNLAKQLRDRTLKANLAHSLWSIFDVLLYPAVYVLFTPLLVAQLGKDGYGLFVLVNTIVVFMQIFNFGLGVNTLKNVAAAIGKGRLAAAIPLLQTNIAIALVTALVCMIASFSFAQLSGHFHWFGIPVSLRNTSFVTISLAGVIGGQKILEQVLSSALIAFEKIGAAARYNSTIRICNLLITLVLVSLRADLTVIFSTTVFVYVCGLYYLYRKLHAQTGDFPVVFRLDRSFIIRELRYSRWIWLQSVFVILAFQFDKFLIGYWYGISDFSYYSIVSTVFNHLHLALVALAPWAMPQIAKQFAAGMEIRAYYRNCRSLIHIVSYCGILFMSLFHDLAFRLWLGKDLMAHVDGYVHLFMCFELLLTFTIAPYFFLNATGSERLATINTLIYTALSLAGLFTGHYFLHGIGQAVGCSIVFLFAGMLIQQVIVARVLSRSALQETLGLLSPAVLLILFILSDKQILIIRGVLLLASIGAFYYVYKVLYPFRISLFKTQKKYSDA
ncbi:hypothetical protein [Rurimicrobium arvi]|uniref:Membrane protein involved in the export of O-antigen and teichoic acid n=1 Tax=Rurimicrobium arvi TaxID=2049916 RepID=A0ABP8N1M2_9BACT